jgi:2-oxoglutarate ferredoxin oxidoreductase subunit beta
MWFKMKPEVYDIEDVDIAWCPGCGNFSILKNLKIVLAELEIDPRGLVLVSGIGQAGKFPHFLKWQSSFSCNSNKSSKQRP